jgi:hypothetical protein
MAHGDEDSCQPSGEIPPLFQATVQDDESVAQMVALLDYQDALPSARRLRDWAIETAAVQPGDHVVDLGSGTGTMSRQLASLVALVPSAGGVGRAGDRHRAESASAGRRRESGEKQLAYPIFLLSMDLLARCCSTTQPPISSGVSACCSISLIRRRRSMT